MGEDRRRWRQKQYETEKQRTVILPISSALRSLWGTDVHGLIVCVNPLFSLSSVPALPTDPESGFNPRDAHLRGPRTDVHMLTKTRQTHTIIEELNEVSAWMRSQLSSLRLNGWLLLLSKRNPGRFWVWKRQSEIGIRNDRYWMARALFKCVSCFDDELIYSKKWCCFNSNLGQIRTNPAVGLGSIFRCTFLTQQLG